MGSTSAHDLSHIGEPLASVRAGIDIVQRGEADRVIVHVLTCEQLLPAARALGKAAGVMVEANWWPDDQGCDIVIRSGRQPA